MTSLAALLAAVRAASALRLAVRLCCRGSTGGFLTGGGGHGFAWGRPPMPVPPPLAVPAVPAAADEAALRTQLQHYAAAARGAFADNVHRRPPKVRGVSQESSRPAVSEIVADLLSRHRAEIDTMD